MSIFGKSYGTKISGQVFINGKEVKLNTVQEAIDNKLAYVTEDRKGNGLILSKSIKMNTSLANMKGISNGKVIDADKEYAIAEEYRKKLKTKCPSVEQNVGNLSGGNQQKVLLAKWMFAEPDILILDEPTRGIDVGAKYEIYCIINDLVAAGKSVIMISSELPEVLGMSDRIYIMNEGRFVGEVGKEEATSELIMSKIVKSGKGSVKKMEKKISFSEILKKYTMVIVLVLVVIMFAVNTKGVMLLPQNVNNLVAQNAYVFILATGMLFCILTGGNI